MEMQRPSCQVRPFSHELPLTDDNNNNDTLMSCQADMLATSCKVSVGASMKKLNDLSNAWILLGKVAFFTPYPRRAWP